jgi:hypothetical protein
MSPTVFQEGSQLNDEQEDEEDEADASSVSPSDLHWEAQCQKLTKKKN